MKAFILTAHLRLILSGIFCFTSAFLCAAPSHYDLTSLRFAMEEYKLYRSAENFVLLRSVSDSLRTSRRCADQRTRSYFWVRMVEADLLLSHHPSITTEKLFYLNRAKANADSAVHLAAPAKKDTALIELMINVYSCMASIHFTGKDSAQFFLAMHKRDSVYRLILPPQQQFQSPAPAEQPVVTVSAAEQPAVNAWRLASELYELRPLS